MTTQTPKLRFPEFSELESSYKKHYFKDIFIFSTGKNIKQNEASPEFETPCVRYGELYHMYSEVISEVVNKTNLAKSELLFSDGDEILLPSAGEDPLDIGSASALTVANVAIGRTINVLKPQKSGIYSQIYVSYYINQKLRKQISTLAKGVSISNVYNSDLKTLEIILPQLPEQTKIANFLTAIDEKIQALKQKKTLLEQYKKGIMQQIFSQELRFKNDDGSDFDDWEEKSLGEITYKTDKKNKEKEILPVYSISNKNGFVHQSEQFDGVDSVERGYDTSLYKIVEANTFAYNPARINVGSIGYSGSLERVLVSSLYVCFRTVSTVDSLFFNYFLETKYFNDSVNRSSEGGIRSYLFYENFSQIKINLPKSVKEQKKIATFLSAIDEKIEKVNERISTTETYKKGLLQQMFI